MRKLLSILLTVLMLLSTALAAEPANPADPSMVAALLPGYIYVEGIDDGDELRLLMRNPDGALVFVGGVLDTSGEWRLTESTPLPEGTILGMEHSPHALIIRSGADYASIEMLPYADGTWGLSHITPAGIASKSIQLRQHILFTRHILAEDTRLADHPWSDITAIDWTTLPSSYDEAVAAIDSSRWAVTSSPDPFDRVHLRASPNQNAESLGSYYNSTPVCIRQYGETWCAVSIGSLEGWMMTRYLVNGSGMGEVPSAAPVAVPHKPETQLHVRPSRSSDYVLREMEYPISPYILGKEGYWYHVWLPDTEEYGYVHVDDLSP